MSSLMRSSSPTRRSSSWESGLFNVLLRFAWSSTMSKTSLLVASPLTSPAATTITLLPSLLLSLVLSSVICLSSTKTLVLPRTRARTALLYSKDQRQRYQHSNQAIYHQKSGPKRPYNWIDGGMRSWQELKKPTPPKINKDGSIRRPTSRKPRVSNARIEDSDVDLSNVEVLPEIDPAVLEVQALAKAEAERREAEGAAHAVDTAAYAAAAAKAKADNELEDLLSQLE
ncbi:hypothetical protein BJ878DRAFT_481206 [Calycina marina]|uniref:Uncharacterized protein n=1 Tax=Calycina marina TaxID=1763456 RepID=A0A9P8CE23_9HELO|nr:hypothetical protein BJ878DRAFT_481206 [Calycina marina]